MSFRSFQFARFFVIIFFLLLFGVLPEAAHAEGEFRFDVELTYKIKEDNSVEAVYDYTVINQTSSFALSALSIQTALSGAKNLTAAYESGQPIPASSTEETVKSGDISYTSSKINLTFPRQIVGKNRRWGFTVRFTADSFIIDKGLGRTVWLPAVGDGPASFTLIINAPNSFGPAHFGGAVPSDIVRRDSDTSYRYTLEQLKKSAWISFGEAVVYEGQFKFPLENRFLFWRDIWIALPPNLSTQEVFIKSITPKPAEIKLDDDGNVLARFRLNPFQKLTVTADVAVKVKYLEYDLSTSGFRKDIPKELVDRYAKADKYWETTAAAVKDKAAPVYDDTKPVSDNVRALYQLTMDTLTYNPKKLEFNLRLGAEKALSEPQNAVCMEFADLLIAMLRSQGIPARNLIGYAYSEGLKPSNKVDDSLHSWVEAYIPDVGWVVVDPTWGKKADNFAASDFDHVVFSVFGLKSDAPGAISVHGRDLGYQYEQATLGLEKKDITAEPKGALSLRAFPLPFGVLVRSQVKNNGISTLYGTTLALDYEHLYPQTEVNLGETPPFGTSILYFIATPSGLKNIPLKGVFSAAPWGGLSAVLAEETVRLPFIAGFGIGAVLVLLAVVLILRRIMKKRTQQNRTAALHPDPFTPPPHE